MMVTVTDIDVLDATQLVTFESEYGVGRGVWADGKAVVGQHYGIEFTDVFVYVWGESLFPAPESEPRIWLEDDRTCIQGTVDVFIEQYEGEEDDGTREVVIRTGPSTYDITVFGPLPELNTWVRFSVKSAHLELYDMKL